MWKTYLQFTFSLQLTLSHNRLVHMFRPIILSYKLLSGKYSYVVEVPAHFLALNFERNWGVHFFINLFGNNFVDQPSIWMYHNVFFYSAILLNIFDGEAGMEQRFNLFEPENKKIIYKNSFYFKKGDSMIPSKSSYCIC